MILLLCINVLLKYILVIVYNCILTTQQSKYSWVISNQSSSTWIICFLYAIFKSIKYYVYQKTKCTCKIGHIFITVMIGVDHKWVKLYQSYNFLYNSDTDDMVWALFLQAKHVRTIVIFNVMILLRAAGLVHATIVVSRFSTLKNSIWIIKSYCAIKNVQHLTASYLIVL